MCSLDNIRWLEDVSVYYSVDEVGDPTVRVDTTGGDFLMYYCTEHQEDFYSWNDVLSHVKEVN